MDCRHPKQHADDIAHPGYRSSIRRENGPMGMTWEREFFSLAGFMLGCKMRANGGTVEGDSDPRCASVLANGHDSIGCQIGEMDSSTEMHLVLKEAGMLRRQRLARCAAGLGITA